MRLRRRRQRPICQNRELQPKLAATTAVVSYFMWSSQVRRRRPSCPCTGVLCIHFEYQNICGAGEESNFHKGSDAAAYSNGKNRVIFGILAKYHRRLPPSFFSDVHPKYGKRGWSVITWDLTGRNRGRETYLHSSFSLLDEHIWRWQAQFV